MKPEIEKALETLDDATHIAYTGMAEDPAWEKCQAALALLREELERLTDDLLDAQGDSASDKAQAESFAKLYGEATARAEKAEGEVEDLRLFRDWANDELSLAKEQYLKLFTKLARFQPLVEAAKAVRFADKMCLALADYATIEAEALFQAALDLQAAEKREEGKPCPTCGGAGIVYSDPDGRQLVCGDCDGDGSVPE